MPTWILYLAVAGLSMLPGLLTGPSLDAAVFETVAWRLSEGDALYADVWDHKPPGLYTPSLLAHLLTGESSAAWRVTWAISVLCVVATAWLIERILRAQGLGWPARLAGVLATLVLSSYLLTLGGGMGELYAAVPAALSVTLVATGSDRIARWYVAGLVAGLAWTISLQLGAAAGMLAVLGLSASARVALQRAAMATLGVLTVALLIVGAGVVSGTTAEAWDALITYNGAYRLEAVAAPSATLLPWTFLVLLPLIVPAAMALIQARRRSADRRLVMGSMVWIALAVMTIGFQGRLYGHYAISMVVPLGLLAGIGFRGLAVSLPRGALGRLFVAAPIAMTVVLSLIVGGVAASMERRQIRDSNERVHATAPEVEALTRPGDTILVWGNEPRLYEAANQTPALRYVYLYPILTDGYVTPELITDLVQALAASPPAVVIDAGSPAPGEPGFPPLLIDRSVATDGRDTDLLDPLRGFIEERYCLVSEGAGWPIYQHTPAGRCTS